MNENSQGLGLPITGSYYSNQNPRWTQKPIYIYPFLPTILGSQYYVPTILGSDYYVPP